MLKHQFDIEKAFQSPELFLDLLKKDQIPDRSTWRQISQHVTSEPKLFSDYGVIFLNYIIEAIHFKHNLIKLDCINTYYLPYIANCNEKAEEAGSKIFRFCLKIRNSKQELYDIELYNALYLALDHTAPSTVESWRRELDLVQEGEQKLLESIDGMIENYLYDPSVYPQTLSFKDQKVIDNVSARFALFNVLYSSEMRPLRIDNSHHFNLSKSWSNFLSQMHKSHGRRTFSIRIKLIEDDLWKLDTKALTIEKSDFALDNKNCSCFDPQELENVIRECIESLKLVHIRDMPTIAYCLLQLMSFASSIPDKQFIDRVRQLTQASWFEIFQTLLNGAAFEAGPCEDSVYFQKLIKVSACYILLNTHLGYSPTDFPISIWDHYYLQRSIFLKSTGTWNQSARLEKLIFTCTASPTHMV